MSQITRSEFGPGIRGKTRIRTSAASWERRLDCTIDRNEHLGLWPRNSSARRALMSSRSFFAFQYTLTLTWLLVFLTSQASAESEIQKKTQFGLRIADVLIMSPLSRAMTEAPSDFLASHPKVHSPWFGFGEIAAAKLVAQQSSSVSGRRNSVTDSPRVILLPIPSRHMRFQITTVEQFKELKAHRLYNSLQQQIGAKSISEVLAIPAAKARADRYVRSVLIASCRRVIAHPIAKLFPSASVLVVECDNVDSPSAVLAAATKPGKTSVLVPRSTAISISAAIKASLSEIARSIAQLPNMESSAAPAAAASTVAPPARTGEVEGSLQGEGDISWSMSGDGQIHAVDKNGTAIFATWQPVTEARRNDGRARQLPASEVKKIKNGIQVTYRYINEDGYWKDMASLELPTFALGHGAILHDTRELGLPISLDGLTSGWSGNYPRDLYCPAVVLRNSDIAIGISVEYQVLEYKHDIGLAVRHTGDGLWTVEVGLENTGSLMGNSYLAHCPFLPPRTTLEYRVNIVADRPEKWVETLEPYRHFLHSTYGTTRYVRDGRAIAGVSLAFGENISDCNPRGWAGSIGDPIFDNPSGLLSVVRSRFEQSSRVCIWAPTGLTRFPALNFPFHFATGFAASGVLHSRLATSNVEAIRSGLSALADSPGRTLGLWWGNSASPRVSWEDASVVQIDGNPNSIASRLCVAEMAAAVDSGATLVGLDAFAHVVTPIWALLPHLRQLQGQFPQVRFCTEGRSPDLLHLHAATWVDGFSVNDVSYRSRRVARDRFHLADFLVPGHETWLGMQFDRSNDPRLWGSSADSGAQRRDVEEAASWGYVPVVWTEIHPKDH